MGDFSDFGDEAIGELSKSVSTLLGKTALDQITGKSGAVDLTSKVKQQSRQKSPSLGDELAKFAESATSQVSGDKPITSSEIAKMVKKDDQFSEASQEEVRQKILQIYREYENKKKQKQTQEEMTEKQEEQKQVAELQERQEAKEAVTPQVGKARAEIGKNYGTE